jgi:glutathione S-transferase
VCLPSFSSRTVSSPSHRPFWNIWRKLIPLNHLRKVFGRSEQDVEAWIATRVGQGLDSVEALIGDDGFCFGPEPMLVDVCRLPQLCAARRFGVPLEAYPRILRVEKVAGEHPAFLSAHPTNQPDAE